MTNRKKESHHDRLHFLLRHHTNHTTHTHTHTHIHTHTHTHTHILSRIFAVFSSSLLLFFSSSLLLFFSLSLLPHLPRDVGVVSHCEVSVRESDTVLIRVLGKLLNRCHQQAHPTLVAWGGNRCVRAWACVGVRVDGTCAKWCLCAELC